MAAGGRDQLKKAAHRARTTTKVTRLVWDARKAEFPEYDPREFGPNERTRKVAPRPKIRREKSLVVQKWS